MRSKKAFTLIELLVVIAIIALLLSIITPALRKAKDAARGVICRTNLKQLGMGLHSYYVDNDNKALVSDGGIEFWFMQIAPYLGDRYAEDTAGSTGLTAHDQLRSVIPTVQCPVTKGPVKQWNSSLGFNGNVSPGTTQNQYRYHVERIEGSYAMNTWIGGWNWYFNSNKVDQAVAEENKRKSYRDAGCMKPDVPAILDGLWVGVMPVDGTAPVPSRMDGFTWDSNNNGHWDSGEWFTAAIERICTDRHGKTTNVVFGDGHTEKVNLEDLWTLRWHKDYVPNYNVRVLSR